MSEGIFNEAGPDGVELVEIARFSKLADARERGLVATTMELPHWIVRKGREYTLCVQPEHRDRITAALAEFESEEKKLTDERKIEPLRISIPAVVMTLAAMAVMYRFQTAMAPEVVERGIADAPLIRSGEWWRCFSALTLHGDSEHLVSNMMLAALAFAFAYGRFGVGFGLLGTILGGALGNGLNAFFQGDHHRSLGSSTALFAALGLLCGAEIYGRFSQKARSRWPLIVPFGAAIAFLGLYGGGGGVKPDGTPIPIGQVDLGAHLFGLAAGLFTGVALSLAKPLERSSAIRFLSGGAAICLLLISWRLTRP